MTAKASGKKTVVVLVAVTVIVSVAACLTVKATARTQGNPWAVPWFREAWAEWVAQSVEDRTVSDAAGTTGPDAATLETAVAVLTAPVASSRGWTPEFARLAG